MNTSNEMQCLQTSQSKTDTALLCHHDYKQLGAYTDRRKKMSSITLSALHSMSLSTFLSGFALHACSNQMQRDDSTTAMLNAKRQNSR